MLRIEVFENVLVVSPFADGVHWYVRAPLEWKPKVGNPVIVPAGFVTDFASVPRPIWSLFPKWGKYGLASVIHDYLYARGFPEREVCDAYMREAMHDLREDEWKINLIYGAVRAGGGVAWRSNAASRTRRDIRIINTFPSSPNEGWQEYCALLRPVDEHDGLVVGAPHQGGTSDG